MKRSQLSAQKFDCVIDYSEGCASLSLTLNFQAIVERYTFLKSATKSFGLFEMHSFSAISFEILNVCLTNSAIQSFLDSLFVFCAKL
jgi:hypothetical protein